MDGELVPESLGKMVGILIHELAHINTPPLLFPTRDLSELAMDQVSFRVMEAHGFDITDYRTFTDLITEKQARHKPESVTVEELFNPTVKEYLARLSTSTTLLNS